MVFVKLFGLMFSALFVQSNTLELKLSAIYQDKTIWSIIYSPKNNCELFLNADSKKMSTKDCNEIRGLILKLKKHVWDDSPPVLMFDEPIYSLKFEGKTHLVNVAYPKECELGRDGELKNCKNTELNTPQKLLFILRKYRPTSN